MANFSNLQFNRFLMLLILAFSLYGCKHAKNSGKTCSTVKNDTTIQIDTVLLDIKTPKTPAKGTILLLQGWNFPRTDWCSNSDFCLKALERGYVLVMPETGKTVYHSEIFPETRKDWMGYPTGKWMWDTLVPSLQSRFCLFEKGAANFVAGISTGGRGAALACLNLPEIFSAGASLSGDFDQRMMSADNLMTGYYGLMESFPARWSGLDNPNANWRKWKTPFLISHGTADSIVPFSQSEAFYHTLKDSLHFQSLKFLPIVNAGHDYSNWGSRTEDILDFFDTYQSIHP